MSEKTYSVEFCVEVCIGRGDGGEVYVTCDVSEEEYENLQRRESDDEIDDCLSEETLEQIRGEAIGESLFCYESMKSGDDAEEEDSEAQAIENATCYCSGCDVEQIEEDEDDV